VARADGRLTMPTHAESRIVPYRPEQMWDLVADVDRYPQFLPWCVAARVRERSETVQLAEMTIGFGPFRESFSSRNELARPRSIKVHCVRGPFRYLENVWSFEPHPRGCKIDFWVDFEFRSRILRAAIGVVFNEATRRMVNAFQRRARQVYGAPRVEMAAAAEVRPQQI
jgi:coenzyme Q-binding protein COQ10